MQPSEEEKNMRLFIEGTVIGKKCDCEAPYEHPLKCYTFNSLSPKC